MAEVLRFARGETRETLTDLPTDPATLTRKTLDLIEECRVSVGNRISYYKMLHNAVESGTTGDTKSMANLLEGHIDRLASHLFSPTDLQFKISFTYEYPAEVLKRAQMAAKALLADFSHRDADIMFGQGVYEALKYGSCFFKQWVPRFVNTPRYETSLVMPWQFGVYREDQIDLDKQPAMVETIMLTLPEVWRTIAHLPNAKDLFRRIKNYANKGQAGDEFNTFNHQLLSTSKLNTGVGGAQTPGGLIQTNSAGSTGSISTQIAPETVKLHELWVWDRNDYVTVQIIEPDILVEPSMRLRNLLIPGADGIGIHPYSKIQPNVQSGYIWGRSEVINLIEPQEFMTATLADIKRLFGLQIDKLLGFVGFEGLTDELYDQQRGAGYINVPMGGAISDLTPKFPPEALQMVELATNLIEKISGFDNLLSGKGEPGVRAGNHANTLMKTASPRLRDRALLLERQLTLAAQLRFDLMQAKDARNYWTNGDDIEGTSFLLSDLPADGFVTVDSHSGSPIFMEDHKELVAFGLKAGFIDGESAIEMLNFPDKDLLIRRLHAKQKQEQQMLQELLKRDPAAAERLMAGRRSHH